MGIDSFLISNIKEKLHCHSKTLYPNVKCKGEIKLRFTGGDEAIYCDKHWKEVQKNAKEMGH